MSDIKPEVVKIQEKIRPHLKLEGEVINVSKEAFEESLPDHLTAKHFADVETHKKNLATGLLLESQTLSEADMKKGKVDSVSAKMALGRSGSIEVEINRKETRPKSVQDRTPVDVYGASRVKIKGTASNKTGDLKKAQEIISERAKNLWGD